MRRALPARSVPVIALRRSMPVASAATTPRPAIHHYPVPSHRTRTPFAVHAASIPRAHDRACLFHAREAALWCEPNPLVVL
eukprot:4858538-Pleurochrysis_carterae.AAC.1